LLEFIKSGRLSAVGVMSHERDIGNPDIPAAGDSPELKGMDYYFWTGIFGPAEMPDDIVKKINTAFNRAMANPEIHERFKSMGVKSNATMTPEEFSNFVANSSSQWQKAIEEAGVERQYYGSPDTHWALRQATRAGAAAFSSTLPCSSTPITCSPIRAIKAR